MVQTKGEVELKLQKTIGVNLKTARQQVALMSMSEVMQKVWGISDRKNRLSEIENGARMPSPYLLLRLCTLYGVSIDYVFGISHDIEKDLECARAGRIVQGLRETALDMVDRIGEQLAQQVSVMPRSEALLLRDRALDIVCYLRQKIEDGSKGPVDKDSPADQDDILEKEDLIDRINGLELACRQLDTIVARHFRVMELTIFDHVNRSDNLAVSRYLTDYRAEKDIPVDVKEFNTDWLEEEMTVNGG